MPLVQTQTIFDGGDVPTAAQLNAPYDSAGTVSNDIDTDNTASGWLTWRHLETALTGVPVANKLYSYQNPTKTSTSYNNTVYATVTGRVKFEHATKAKKRIRVEAAPAVAAEA